MLRGEVFHSHLENLQCQDWKGEFWLKLQPIGSCHLETGIVHWRQMLRMIREKVYGPKIFCGRANFHCWEKFLLFVYIYSLCICLYTLCLSSFANNDMTQDAEFGHIEHWKRFEMFSLWLCAETGDSMRWVLWCWSSSFGMTSRFPSMPSASCAITLYMTFYSSERWILSSILCLTENISSKVDVGHIDVRILFRSCRSVFVQISTSAVSTILKVQKRRHVKEKFDPYAVAGCSPPSHMITPGHRADNMWLHYDGTPHADAANTTFVDKTHWGFYMWPK